MQENPQPIRFERRIRWYQQPLHSYLVNGGKRAIEVAHRRWGKDEIALAATCELSYKRIGTYWHCLPEYAQGRKALWTAVNAHTGKRRIDEAFPPEVCDSRNEQEMFIKLKWGSTWQIIGSDRYDSTVGAGPVGIVYSEWALANPSAWAYHRPMVEENDGWAAFITTPRGHNHAKTMFDMAKRTPGWFAELSTVGDTKALSTEKLEETLTEYKALYGEDVGNAQFEQEYNCSFNAAILGAFYAREMSAVRRDRVQEIEADPEREVHTCWDLGVTDSTAIWWFQMVGTQIYILDYYVTHNAGVDHYAEVCHKKPWKRGIDYVPHDARVKEFGAPGARSRIETMKLYGLNPSVVGLAKKLDGINAVRRALPKCVFHPRCEEGIAALELYRREWDDERKTFGDNEIHDWTSHGADAFRYLAMAWRELPAAPEAKPKGRTIHEMTLNELYALEPKKGSIRI